MHAQAMPGRSDAAAKQTTVVNSAFPVWQQHGWAGRASRMDNLVA
jgi:hypothetical protein